MSNWPSPTAPKAPLLSLATQVMGSSLRPLSRTSPPATTSGRLAQVRGPTRAIASPSPPRRVRFGRPTARRRRSWFSTARPCPHQTAPGPRKPPNLKELAAGSPAQPRSWAQFVPPSAVSGWRMARVPSAARSRIPTAYVAVSSRLPRDQRAQQRDRDSGDGPGPYRADRLGGPADHQRHPRDEQHESAGEHPAGRRRSSLVRMHDQLLQTHPGQDDAEGQREVAVDEKVVACVETRPLDSAVSAPDCASPSAASTSRNFRRCSEL